MTQQGNETGNPTREEALRELVASARVYYKNDKHFDWSEWQHLSNEAETLGLTEDDALRCAREAVGNPSWSPPIPPPLGSRWSVSIDGPPAAGRAADGAANLQAISLSGTDAPETSNDRLKTGVLINDTYRLDQEIGAGGMGTVWKASHIKLRTTVAIKFLKQAMDEDSAARFLREARSAAKIESPHVSRVFDCAQLSTGELFIVMEHFTGSGLDAYLDANGPLPVGQAVDFLLEACVGVAAAHRHEIVHRDIKPANLFLSETEDGERTVKVVDFGLSRAARAEDGEGLTRDQILLGTPEYAPPEQFGSAMNAREPADIWSLGATLYCLLAGKSPFPRNATLTGLFQLSDLLERVTKAAPSPLSKQRKDVPPGLEKVILKCLEKKPEDRYPTVADLALDLAEFGSDKGRASAGEVVQVLSTPRNSRSSIPAVRTSNWPSRISVLERAVPAPTPPGTVTVSKRSVVIVLAMMVLAIGVVAVWVVGR